MQMLFCAAALDSLGPACPGTKDSLESSTWKVLLEELGALSELVKDLEVAALSCYCSLDCPHLIPGFVGPPGGFQGAALTVEAAGGEILG